MKGGLVILTVARKMLRKFLMTSSVEYELNPAVDFEDDASGLPDDVKEGHFAVHTVEDGELKRFVMELSYLAHPGFMKLLEQAEEEFGFGQIGILAIPCTYSYLQSVLEKSRGI